MASIDMREKGIRHPVVRVEVPVITCLNGGVVEATETVNINMTIKTIVVRTPNVNAITFTLELRDTNGAILVTKTLIPENYKTVLLSTKATPDFPEVCMNGVVTVGLTASGDPGADAPIYVDLFGI